MNDNWTKHDAGGAVGDGLPETDIPTDAEHLLGWNRDKAEGVEIYGHEGRFWVVHSVTGRLRAVSKESSFEAAHATAQEFKKESQE